MIIVFLCHVDRFEPDSLRRPENLDHRCSGTSPEGVWRFTVNPALLFKGLFASSIDRVTNMLDARTGTFCPFVPLVGRNARQVHHTVCHGLAFGKNLRFGFSNSPIISSLGTCQLGASHPAEPARIRGFFDPAIVNGQGTSLMVASENGTVCREDSSSDSRHELFTFEWFGSLGAKGGSLSDLQLDQAAEDHDQQENEPEEDPPPGAGNRRRSGGKPAGARDVPTGNSV